MVSVVKVEVLLGGEEYFCKPGLLVENTLSVKLLRPVLGLDGNVGLSVPGLTVLVSDDDVLVMLDLVLLVLIGSAGFGLLFLSRKSWLPPNLFIRLPTEPVLYAGLRSSP